MLIKSRVECLVNQSCPTFRDPMNCSLPGSSVHGDSLGKNTRVGSDALLQRIFPTQGSNPGPPHCRQILYHLSHQGSLEIYIYIIYIYILLLLSCFSRVRLCVTL